MKEDDVVAQMDETQALHLGPNPRKVMISSK
jgi:hypothetical protein